MLPNHHARERAIRRIEQCLRRHGTPRGAMTIIVLGTGLSGFLASVGLLHLGVLAPCLRYPLAVLAAYGVFTGLIRLWLALSPLSIKPAAETHGTDFDDVVYGLDYLPLPGDSCGSVRHGDGFLSALDLDEAVVLVLVALALLAGVAAGIYVIVIAPAFLAELALDSALSAGLYRHLRHIEAQSWTMTVFRRTGWLFLVVFVFFLVAGAAIQAYAPQAHSLGDVFRHAAMLRNG